MAEPRVTKAQLAEATAELTRMTEAYNRMAAEREQALANANHWRQHKLPDPEAEALAGCIRALEPVTTTSGSFGPLGTSGRVERILVHLAMRYGVQLQPAPEPAEAEPHHCSQCGVWHQ